MRKNYSDKFKDPQWQKKRLEIMSRDAFACKRCYESEQTLSVHHLYYVSNRDPWNYPGWSLITLCNDCQSSQHLIYAQEEEMWESAVSRFAVRSPFWCDYFYDIAAMYERLSEKIGEDNAANRLMQILEDEIEK
jgi:hypothetical protein